MHINLKRVCEHMLTNLSALEDGKIETRRVSVANRSGGIVVRAHEHDLRDRIFAANSRPVVA